MRALLQRDDKKVVTLSIIIAIMIVSYFAVQKFRGNEEPVQASFNHPSVSDQSSDDNDNHDTSSHEGDRPYWGKLAGQEVDVWIYGAENESDRIASMLADNWPSDSGMNIHNESDSDLFLLDTWLEIVEAAPLPENSFVLLQWDEWQTSDLTTLENYLRQLLSEQPHLAITVVTDNNGELPADFDSLLQAYDVSSVSVDELTAVLPDITFAHLPDESLYDGMAATVVDRVASTDLFHGDVELRPLSSADNPFLFDQYYALFEPGSQIDYEVAGRQVGIVYLTDSNGGIGAVEVNGNAVGEIDGYSTELSQQVAWIPLTDRGTHTVSITYTGERHERATDSQVFVAGLIVVTE